MLPWLLLMLRKHELSQDSAEPKRSGLTDPLAQHTVCYGYCRSGLLAPPRA